MKDPNISKGTKVRLWMLQVPLPKVPPIIVAAIPISDRLTVSQTLEFHKTVIFGLLDEDINVISYACDGTETERSLQRAFTQLAETSINVIVPSPRDGLTELQIPIPVFRGHPISMVQDSKHALKTFRNNLFSGARLLVMGNYAAFFQQIHDIAFEESSPLYHRDVEKLDRQDDNAASRLFSAATLQFISKKHPDQIGVIVYLFIFGELCDAYQNRNLNHSERINILLRSRYFIDMLQQFIDKIPCYKPHQHFISREAFDIISFLINGLISLIIIHRDHHPHIPLLPWLHSSEACEHVFGLARQIIKDFTMLDFYQMVPKLLVCVREAAFDSNLSQRNEEMKARASGYHHTYSDMHELDLMSLSRFPSEAEICQIAQRAADEADSLIALLGIYPNTLHSMDIHLPGINSFNFSDSDEDLDNGSDGDLEELNLEMDELERLIKFNEESGYQLTNDQQDRLEVLTSASLALLLEDQIQIQALADEVDDETYEEYLSHDCRAVKDALLRRSDIPTINLDQPAIISEDIEDLSVESLVALREKHQTHHAAHSIRTQENNKHLKLDQEHSLRQQIISCFHLELRSTQDQGVTTGEGRQTRTQNNVAPLVSAPGGQTRSTRPRTNGNSANAAATATSEANKAAAKRRRIVRKFKLHECIEMGRVTEFKPIHIGDFGFIFLENQVYLAQVIAMYSRTGGKNGKHAAVSTTSNISALSYIAVQFFEHAHAAHFRKSPSFMSPLDTMAYAFLPSYAFLTVLGSDAVIELKREPILAEISQQRIQKTEHS
ncbi:hypothetical protein DFH05DRAFT_1536253 [Lentinula detonsa]|uniref:Uncharacterized protein n=1 Tax=Lentinula detonsa TaxID=2804962 RepID=A0A9W8NY63_9AGAR|nr:hypothetical protein DFH05DRAFT_1536253 [Lentinula detonsa]